MKPSHMVALAALVTAAPLPAATVTDEQLWLDLLVTGSLSGRLQGMAQVQPRFRNDARDTQQQLFRAGLGWMVDPRLTLWVAYTHSELPVAGGPDVNEERAYEQANYILGNAFGGIVSGRTRLEQRWRSNGSDAGWRLRQQVRYVHPLGRSDTALSLVVSVEPGVELRDTDWGARRGLDQLRSFAGIAIPLSRAATVETGYLNQIVNRRRGVTAINHAAFLGLTWRY